MRSSYTDYVRGMMGVAPRRHVRVNIALPLLVLIAFIAGLVLGRHGVSMQMLKDLFVPVANVWRG